MTGTALSLSLAVMAIALPDCINPSLIAADLFLAVGQHPRRRTAAFALAVWTVTFLAGVALALGLGALLLSVLPKPGPTLKHGLIAFFGILLIIGGTVVWFRRRALGSAASPDDSGRRPPGSAVLLGAGIAGVELLTAFPYFAAIALIIGSSIGAAGKIALLVLYCVVYTLPLIAITTVLAVMGNRAQSVLEPARDWLLVHWPVIIAPLLAAIGTALAAYGIAQLS